MCWHPSRSRGRIRPQAAESNPVINGVVRFVNEQMDLLEDSWPLVVEKVDTLENENEWIAEVQFSEGEAPRDKLREGQIFEFFESGESIGSGILLRPE